MLAALIDSLLVQALPPIAWTVLLVAGALVLAGIRRRGARRRPDDGRIQVAHHAVLGMLIMAALQLASIVAAAPAAVVPDAHAHGTTELVPLTLIATLCAAGYGVVTVFAVSRVRGWSARVQLIAMAVAVVLMAGSVIE